MSYKASSAYKTSAPANPKPGDLWVDSDDTVTPVTSYGRRNIIINGDMSVWQRGTTARTAHGDFGPDRWFTQKSTSTYSATQAVITNGDFPNHPEYAWANAVTGSGGAGDYVIMSQNIEKVHTFSNTTVTVSFWAKAASGTPKIGVELAQVFGTGGSPSAAVTGTGQTVTLSTTWTRYSVTVVIPSIAGKTLGSTANTHYLQFNLWLSAGSTYNTRSGSIGSQTNTFTITQVQVESGSVMTDFEQQTYQETLDQCLRFYQSGTNWWGGYIQSGIGAGYNDRHTVPFRIAPSMSWTNTSNVGFAASVASTCYADYMAVYRAANGTGAAVFSETWTASAEY